MSFSAAARVVYLNSEPRRARNYYDYRIYTGDGERRAENVCVCGGGISILRSLSKKTPEFEIYIPTTIPNSKTRELCDVII